MKVFVGFILIDKIHNQKKYRLAIKQIQHYLKLHPHHIKVIQNDNILTIRPTYNNNEFNIVKDGGYFHSHYNKFDFQENLSEEQICYFQICIQCSLILKEHFPSKLDFEISVEDPNLKMKLQSITEHNKSELSRRYVANLRAIMATKSLIQKDEIEDILYILRTEESNKLKLLALNLLNSENIEKGWLRQIQQIDLMTIDRLANEKEYSDLCTQILSKIVKSKSLEVSQVTENQKFDQPNFLKSYIFQLKQSNNLERICFLIEKIINQLELIDSDKIEKIDRAVEYIVDKFLNSNYSNHQKNSRTFITSILNYHIARKCIKNWNLLIQLINLHKNIGQIKTKIEQLLNVLKEYTNREGDTKYIDQLRNILSAEQNCSTERNTSKSYKKNWTKQSYTIQ